jgi:hypothetical protein
VAGGCVLDELEARGLEDSAVAEAAEALDAGLVGHPRDHDAAIAQRLQTMGLRLVDRAAEPREVVGEAAGPVGLAGAPRVLALAALRDPRRADEGNRERTEPVGAHVDQFEHSRKPTR